MATLPPAALAPVDLVAEVATIVETFNGLAAALADTQPRIERLLRLVTPPAASMVVGPEPPDGAALRERRLALGLSQQAVARAAHVSRSEIAEIERGQRRNPWTRAHLAQTLDRLEAEAPLRGRLCSRKNAR